MASPTKKKKIATGTKTPANPNTLFKTNASEIRPMTNMTNLITSGVSGDSGLDVSSPNTNDRKIPTNGNKNTKRVGTFKRKSAIPKNTTPTVANRS